MNSSKVVLWILATTFFAGCSGDDNGNGDNHEAGAAGKTTETQEANPTGIGGRTGTAGAAGAGEAGTGEAGSDGEGGVAEEGGRTGRGGSPSVGGRATATGGRSSAGGAATAGEAGEAGTTATRGGSSSVGGQTGVGGRATGGSPSRGGAGGHTPSCDGCLVESICYLDGDLNPDNPCEKCDIAVDTRAFSNNDSGTCDDGLYCTQNDSCEDGVCTGAPRSCADEVTCNGIETCNEAADTCAPGEPTCEGETFCDHVTNQCVTTCAGCLIDDVCYEADEPNPLNGCEVCAPDSDKTDWSDNDGARCDDELYCNGTDTCRGGACKGHSGSPCHDNGIFCDGLESCSEATDSCVSSGDPCSNDGLWCNGAESCNEDTRACEHTGDLCPAYDLLCSNELASCYNPDIADVDHDDPTDVPFCGDDGNVYGYNAVNDTVDIEQCVSPSENGECRNGVCGCVDGRAGDYCQSCLIHVDLNSPSPLPDPNPDVPPAATTWATAYHTVQNGLLAAEITMRDQDLNSCEVWVAQGTYYASTDRENIDASIQLRSYVALYGGFRGSEFARSERNVSANTTILSGDLDDDGLLDEGNSRNVITGGEDSRATIDGFTITGGYARSYGDYENEGGGMRLDSCNEIAIANCVFSNNRAEYGGGIYVDNTAISITNTVFTGNEAISWGAAIFTVFSSLNVTNSTLTRNTGGEAVLWNHSSDSSGGDPYILNSILWDNDVEGSPVTGAFDIDYSIVQGGFDAGTGNIDQDPQFTADLGLQSSSPAIDAGNGCGEAVPAADAKGRKRIDVLARANATSGPAVDMGAFEYQTENDTIGRPVERFDGGSCCSLYPTITAFGHDYAYCGDVQGNAQTWTNASETCSFYGMTLAVITSTEQNALVTQLADPLQLDGKRQVHIGFLRDPATPVEWLWQNGEPTRYMNWDTNEPRVDATVNYSSMLLGSNSVSDGRWYGSDGNSAWAFICEGHYEPRELK